MNKYIFDSNNKINILNKIPKKIVLIKNQKRKINKKKLFVIISLLIFFISLLVYSFRLIYFYKIEHPKEAKVDNYLLSGKIKNDNKENSNFRLNNKDYLFHGNVDNNYVYYSNQLWRIMEVLEDNSIILISSDNVTSLVYGYNNKDFTDSYAYSWLNEKYYNLLNKPDEYLSNNEICISSGKTKKENCKNKKSVKVGLLSYYQYKQSGANKSYLNIGKYFWTLTPSKDKTWYVFDEGGINDNSYSNNNYYSYGIRPVIKLKKNIAYKSGTGKIDDPYIIDENTLNVGAYIKYSNYTFRIYNKSENKYDLVLDQLLDDEHIFSNNTSVYKKYDYNSLYYYLNNKFYYNLDKTLLLDNDWNIGQYNIENNFDYNSLSNNQVTTKIGLLSASDLFVNDIDSYFTITGYDDDMVLSVNKNGSFDITEITEKKGIRPAISITNKIKIISGSGTKNDPYVVGSES